MEEILSVIVPSKDVESYIEECLLSILATGPVIKELIIIDDGSTDNTVSKIEQIKASYKQKIILLHTDNKGVSFARNAGLQAAKGDFISFIDSDDFVNVDAYSLFIQTAYKQDIDLCIATGKTFYNQTSNENQALKHGLDRLVALNTCPGNLFLEEYLSLKNTNIVCWDKIYKTDYLKRNKISFLNDIIHEDIAFCFESLLKAKSVRCLDIDFYNYRRRHGSIMHTIDEYSARCRRFVVDWLFELEQKLDKRLEYQVINYMAYQMHLAFEVDKKTDRKTLIRLISRRLKFKRLIQLSRIYFKSLS